MSLSDERFQQLLTFRTGLRRFLRWSGERASDAGITAPQHQLLLAIRGHARALPPSIGDLADYLVEKQHSVSGLVDRAVRAGLVRRVTDREDRRVVRVELTTKGTRKLDYLTELHLEELNRLRPRLSSLWSGLDAHGQASRPDA